MRSNKNIDELSIPIVAIADAAYIELTGVLREGEQFYAVFRAGASERILAVDEGDLMDFAEFQRRVARELGIDVRHRCELERSAAERSRAWQKAVEQAFARGS